MTASKPGNTGDPRADPDLRDPRLDAAWRDASREEPPAALDDAILAAARREVGAGPMKPGAAARAARVPEATRPERWWWPLAAAATIGAIAFGLLQLEPAVNGGPSVVSDMPAPATKRAEGPPATRAEGPPATRADGPPATRAEAPTASVQAPKPDAQIPAPGTQTPAQGPASFTQDPPARAREAQAADTSSARKAVAEEASAFPAAGAPATPRAEPPALAKLEEARPSIERARDAAGAPAPAPASATAPAPPPALETRGPARASRLDARQEAAPRDPTLPVAEWIAKIRRLRDEGKFDEAATELAAFRAAYPDHEQRLPPDLREWRAPAK